MAARRSSPSKRPPPRADTLKGEYIDAVGKLRDKLQLKTRLVIGGKSMGGRVASMIADELYASGKIAGLLCLGYPFHPMGKPNQLRTAHLAKLQTPTLIVQGAHDAQVPAGTAEWLYGEIGACDKEVLILPRSGHVVTVDADRELLWPRTYEFIRARAPGSL